MLPAAASYEAMAAAFRWDIPARLNMGVEVCDRRADGSGRLALLHIQPDGRAVEWTFDALRDASNRLANVLRALGTERGERIGILLPQCPETAVAHIATYKLGAIALPLFVLFGEDALAWRLSDAGARVLITDSAGLDRISTIRERLPDLRVVLSVDGGGAPDLRAECARASARFTPEDTGADDPALLIYTSGTTGPPKGALHAHRVLRGHLPGVEMPQDLFPRPGDRMWTPADWAWIGGLLDVLLPSLFHGVPVVAHRMAKFDPDAAFALMARHGVRNAFLPPTALKMMRTARPAAGLALRSVGSGGETLGPELLDWGRQALGVAINEFYGQTECNLTVSSCGALFPARPGWIGRVVPGHRVAVVDAGGQEMPAGTPGAIAVRRPDPVMFLRYWNQPAATAAKFAGDWLLTGDTGEMDDGGWLRFIGRDDDVITSAGYRIGPGEIEDCLLKHPAVAMAAAVGVPDALRTERVKVFAVLAPGHAASEALARELQDFVGRRASAHLRPREVAFVDALPMTATGKIMRAELRRRG